MDGRFKSYIFLYFLLLLVLSYQLIQNIANTFALSSSSSFERQEVSNKQNNGWIFWHLDNKNETIVSKDDQLISIPTADNKSQCTFKMPISHAINSTTYISDGNKINAIIWLSSKLLNNILIKNDIDKGNFNSTSSFLPL
jgi:hypothetical protein